jgi:hypothetical protein
MAAARRLIIAVVSLGVAAGACARGGGEGGVARASSQAASSSAPSAASSVAASGSGGSTGGGAMGPGGQGDGGADSCVPCSECIGDAPSSPAVCGGQAGTLADDVAACGCDSDCEASCPGIDCASRSLQSCGLTTICLNCLNPCSQQIVACALD